MAEVYKSWSRIPSIQQLVLIRFMLVADLSRNFDQLHQDIHVWMLEQQSPMWISREWLEKYFRNSRELVEGYRYETLWSADEQLF